MPVRSGWTRQQLLVALNLYCQIPFGKMHSGNPDIIAYARRIGRTPSALAMKLTNFASLDPTLKSTGRKGLENVSAADKEIWEEMQADWERFAVEARQAEDALGLIAPALEPVEETIDYAGADVLAQARIRLGQNFFRRAVLSSYDYRCCITGLATPALLVASHIVPWRVDPANRLNPRNGLCLSVLHDRAFDLGIITIAEDMTVNVSRRYASRKDSFFESALSAYHGRPISLPEKFQPDATFLAYHRENIFQR